MNNDKPINKDKDNETWEQLSIILGIAVGITLVLPPIIMAILLFIILRPLCVKKKVVSKIVSFIGILLTIIFFSTFPYIEYFGYLHYIPINVEKWKSFSISYKSMLLYFGLGLILIYPMERLLEYYRSKIVKSKEHEMNEKRSTEKYKKTEKNRLEINNKLQTKWREKPVKQDEAVFLGIDEFGNPYYMGDSELNRHALAVATTGGGKTTLFYALMEKSLRKGEPFIFVDGKGDPATISEVQAICDRYNVKLHVFSDKLDTSYNAIKYGNKTSIKDKLMNILDWSEQFYANKSENLLQNVVSFIDDYELPRDLPTVAKFLNPDRIKEILDQDVVTTYIEVENEVEVEVEKEVEVEVFEDEIETSVEEKTVEVDLNNFDINDLVNFSVDETPKEEPKEEPQVKLEKEERKPKLVKQMKKVMEKQVVIEKIPKEEPSERAKKYQEIFFERMQEGAAFEGIEGLQLQIYTLLDSEIGHLFEERENGIDLSKITENKEAVLFSLDGNIYNKFINIMARLVIADVKTLASIRGRRKDKVLAVFDEFSAYGTPDVVDNINKSRSAGFECVIGTQTLADIEKVQKGLVDQIIGNTNTYFFGLANDDYTIEKMSNTLGTYEDNDVTYQTEQSGGGFKRIDMKSEKGTVRQVNKFQVKPQTLREFSIGQFAVWRKAAKENRPADIVYMRNTLEGVETDGFEKKGDRGRSKKRIFSRNA